EVLKQLRTARLCALLMSTVAGPALTQPAPPGPNSPAPPPARLADGHPDLQGLWIKSAGGFQGLFIGSLDGTNFAAAGRGGARGAPPAPQYEYTPEAAAERQDRQRRG